MFGNAHFFPSTGTGLVHLGYLGPRCWKSSYSHFHCAAEIHPHLPSPRTTQAHTAGSHPRSAKVPPVPSQLPLSRSLPLLASSFNARNNCPIHAVNCARFCPRRRRFSFCLHQRPSSSSIVGALQKASQCSAVVQATLCSGRRRNFRSFRHPASLLRAETHQSYPPPTPPLLPGFFDTGRRRE